MPSRTIRLSAGLALLLAALPVFAGKVYQWKDAKGVTHYSDAPPPGQQGVQNRQVKDGRTAEAAAEAKPTEDANCTTARTSLANLKSGKAVGLDADRDGKPDRELSPDERAQQLQQIETMLKTYCDKPAAKP